MPGYKTDQLARQVAQYAETDAAFRLIPEADMADRASIYEAGLERVRLMVFKEAKALYGKDIDKPSSKYQRLNKKKFQIFK